VEDKMSRNELKEMIIRVIDRMSETDEETPAEGCVFGDSGNCDVTTKYAINEEN
jgi:hypothetical protein